MENFIPESFDLRISLLFCFFLKKSAAEAHRMLAEAYGQHALSERQCRNWFQRFKNNDFDVRNEDRGRAPKKFEDIELQAILNQNDTLTQTQMAQALNVNRSTISIRLKAMGMIQKCGRWVRHEFPDKPIENKPTGNDILFHIKLNEFMSKGAKKEIYTNQESDLKDVEVESDLEDDSNPLKDEVATEPDKELFDSAEPSTDICPNLPLNMTYNNKKAKMDHTASDCKT